MGARRRGTRRGGAQKAGVEVSGEDGAPVQAPPQRTRSTGLKPEVDEILAAIETLYADELKPFGRILRKRLAERANPEAAKREQEQSAVPTTGKAKGSSLPDIDVKHLQAVCEASPLVEVYPEEGGDWSALLVSGDADAFVDIYSAEDPYPEDFWRQAHNHFSRLERGDMLLPGGRYSCAQMLVARELPFLTGFSLGKVCHFVQLAISKHKVLGYSDGSVVPYAYSQSKVKEHLAMSAQPGVSSNGEGPTSVGGLPLATWEDARCCMREILASVAKEMPEGVTPWVPLSNVKRLFRTTYEVELSETALGHAKLSDLLGDDHFRGVCTVKLDGTGYIVVQVSPEVSESAAEEALEEVPEAAVPSRRGFCEDELLDFGSAGFFCEPAPGLPVVTPTQSPGAPASCTVRQWGQVIDDGFQPADRQVKFLDPRGDPLTLDFDSVDGLGGLLGTGFVHQTPLPSPGLGEGGGYGVLMPAPRRVEFCRDDPLQGWEELCCGTTPLPSPGVPLSATTRRWTRTALSAVAVPEASISSSDASPPFGGGDTATSIRTMPVGGLQPSMGWQVQNTFIHTAAAPPTPLPGARCRAHSAPSRRAATEGSAFDHLDSAAGRAFDAQLSGCYSRESTADSAGSGNGGAPPLSPASSGDNELQQQQQQQQQQHQRQQQEQKHQPPDDTTPAKVPLNRLESLSGACEEPEVRKMPLFPGIDEPLNFDDMYAEPTPIDRQRSRTSPYGPGSTMKTACTVLNTFIHASIPPCTPAPGAAKHRSRSVPKDLGSELRAPTVQVPATPAGPMMPPTPTPVGLGPATGPGAGPGPLRRNKTADFAGREPSSPSINDAPLFVPPSPALGALMPSTPQTPLYSSSIYLQPAKSRVMTVPDNRPFLRLADYL